jgi:hypothetical protein
MPGSASGLGKRTRHQPDTAPQADSTPRLRAQLATLPWRQIDPAHRHVETAHGRREIRTLKVVTIAAGIAFPHARQAVQITRKTRPLCTHTGRKGRWRTETVYAITDLAPHQARPEELAAWIRGHWQIENGLHWVRDVTFAEDLSQVRTGNGPQVMASLRNLVISLHPLAGAANIAAATRHHARDARRPLRLLGITRLCRPRGWLVVPEDVAVAVADLDGEEDVDPFEGDRAVHVEEVDGEHGRSLRAQEPAPGRVGGPHWCRRYPP